MHTDVEGLAAYSPSGQDGDAARGRPARERALATFLDSVGPLSHGGFRDRTRRNNDMKIGVNAWRWDVRVGDGHGASGNGDAQFTKNFVRTAVHKVKTVWQPSLES
jgi:hypothetical protein